MPARPRASSSRLLRSGFRRLATLTAGACAAGGLVALVTAPASATGFSGGTVVVVRVGDGSAAPTSAATPVFLDEYTLAGVRVSTVALPTSASGANRRLTLSGSASSEGALQLSADGRFLVLAGYDAAPGTASVASSAAATTARVVARVGADGSVDTSTALSDATSGNNVRGAASIDGSAFWVAGASGGLRYAAAGATSSAQVTATTANVRTVAVVGGQLYVSASSTAYLTGLGAVGAGTPTSGPVTTVPLSGIPSGTITSAYAFALLDRDPAVPGPDSLYVADDGSSTGGILKYSFDGTTWTSRGTFRPAGLGVRGLTARANGDGSVQLLATTTSASLVAVTDAAGPAAPLAATSTTLATAATNTAFRGVAFSPASSLTPPTVTTDPASTSVASGATATLSVAASGSAPLSYQWFEGASGDTSAPVSGATSAAFTTGALTATTSYWVRVSNAAGSADSAAATVTVQDAPPTNSAPTITPEALDALALTVGDAQPAGRTVTVGDAETPGSLDVTVSSSDASVATGAAAGSGTSRTIAVTPVGVGYATLTITVSDGELSASATLSVAVSAAQPAGRSNLYGVSDASTAVDLGGGYAVVGDDETNVLRVYRRGASGYPTSSLDLRGAGLALPDADPTREIDVEASARTGSGSGSTIYWLGSLGQNSSGKTRLNRQLLFSTAVSSSGSAAALTLGGSYQGLRSDLLAWAQANGDPYGLVAAASRAPEGDPTVPSGPSGLNLEGAEFAPDSTTLYLAFRGPLTSAGKALIVPLLNPAELVAANPTTGVSAQFGTPIELDLGGRGIRELRRNASGDYLILAGGSKADSGLPGQFRLFSWSGDAADAPLPRSTGTTLDSLAAQGGLETIVATPDPLTATSGVELLTDSGDTVWYGDGTVNKELSTAFRKVVGASVSVGTAPACSASDTKIGAVQGSGETSPRAGQTVSVQGTVVADDEGPAPALRGFYLQDGGDGDPLTSDGVFVFNGNADSVSLGQVVQVTGVVSEYQGQTEITVGSIEDCGTTSAPAPVDVTLPLASATALERYEGMLVRLPQQLTVTELFQLGRFGQVVVSSGGRLRQPTQVYAASDPRAAQLQAANALNRLIIDDSLNNQNPDPIAFGRGGQPLSATTTLRGGDTVTGATGVLTYTWAGNSASGNAYRLRPINSLGGEAAFAAANERPTAAPAVGGTIKVASANLLNFFDTFTGCTGGVGGAAMDCRGASDTTEYQRQLAKEVAALTSLHADVVGVMELENDGYGPTSSIQALVDALNAAEGAGTWAFVDPDAATGVTNAAGTDAIRTALLYKPAAVSVVPGTVTTDRTAGAFERNPVAATFATRDGEKVTVVSNHFKSKGSCPSGSSDPNADAGDGQGCWNVRRTQQARELVSWLNGTVIPAAGDPDVVVLGDLNAYAKEDPVAVLTAAGFVDLGPAFSPDGPGGFTYSYAFDGQWGTLDHVLASASLRPRVTGADEVHINADEPSVLDYLTDYKSAGQLTSLYAPDRFRTSDHDPVVVGLDLAPAPVAPKITGAKNLTATVGTPFSYGYAVSGTPAPVVAVTAGTLPSGLSLSEGGVLAGTPQAAGKVTITVTATNAAGKASVTSTLTIAAAKTSTKVTAVPKVAVFGAGIVYTATVTAASSGVVPTGTVTFTVGGSPAATVALVDGVATTSPITAASVGVVPVVAVYSGSAATKPSTGKLSVKVSYGLPGLASPIAGGYKAGATVPVRFAVTDALGSAIPDAAAAALVDPAGCRVTVAVTGAQTQAPTCARYDSAGHRFVADWASSALPGAVAITVTLTYPDLPATTRTVKVRLLP